MKYTTILLLFCLGGFLGFPGSAFSQKITGDIGLGSNGFLKILKVKSHELSSAFKENKIQHISGIPLEYIREISGSGSYIEVLVEVLREPPQGGPHKVCVHYYDENGEPLPGDSEYTESGLSPGEIRAVDFEIPGEAKSFKIWLPSVERNP